MNKNSKPLKTLGLLSVFAIVATMRYLVGDSLGETGLVVAVFEIGVVVIYISIIVGIVKVWKKKA